MFSSEGGRPMLNLGGTISVVGNHGTSGIVTFDEPYNGFEHGVLNYTTKGRIALMTAAHDGKLMKGLRVIVTRVQKSVDANLILAVRAEDDI